MTQEQVNSLAMHEVEKPNPAELFLEQDVRPLVGDQITDFWKAESKNWSQRFVKKTLSDLTASVGIIPETRVINPDPVEAEKEAANLLKFKTEHWMIGADIRVAGYLTITLATESLRHPQSQQKTEALLKTIGGAQARINWERKHELNLKKINSLPDKQREELLDQENTRYNSQVNKLQFLQNSQGRYTKKYQKLSTANPDKFHAHIDRKSRQSLRRFNGYSKLTNTMIGRDDRGNFSIEFLSGPWTQLGLREEPGIKSVEDPKGISVSFYRYNPDTGEKEFFVCFGKRDAFARTHQFTPAWQTSMTRAKEGNHPGQDYNPMLSSLKEAFKTAQSSNGVEISYVDLNANRNDESPIAVATIDWDSYTTKDQELILGILAKENKGKILHSWIPESKIAILRRTGIVDKDGLIGPAINGFLAISIGSRSPKEILQDGVNRHTASRLQQLLKQQPAELQALEAKAQKLIESPDTKAEGLLLQAMLITVMIGISKNGEISDQFPHRDMDLSRLEE